MLKNSAHNLNGVFQINYTFGATQPSIANWLRRVRLIILSSIQASKQMLVLSICNILAGALLGFYLTVLIIIPAAAAVFLEVLFLGSAQDPWLIMLWHFVVLIVLVELGFLLGAGLRIAAMRKRGDDPGLALRRNKAWFT